MHSMILQRALSALGGFSKGFECILWYFSFVVSNCEFVTFPLVSWVRCGT